MVQNQAGVEKLVADTVILALGFESRQDLYTSLIEKSSEAYLIGNAVKPAEIMDAIHTGYRTGLRI